MAALPDFLLMLAGLRVGEDCRAGDVTPKATWAAADCKQTIKCTVSNSFMEVVPLCNCAIGKRSTQGMHWIAKAGRKRNASTPVMAPSW